MSAFLELLGEFILSEETVTIVLSIPGFWLVSEINNKKTGLAYSELVCVFCALRSVCARDGSWSDRQRKRSTHNLSPSRRRVWDPLWFSSGYVVRAMHPCEAKDHEENQV